MVGTSLLVAEATARVIDSLAYPLPAHFWHDVASAWGVHPDTARLIGALPGHLGLGLLAFRPLRRLSQAWRWLRAQLGPPCAQWRTHLPRAWRALDAGASLLLVAVWVPFVLQPTLVRGYEMANWRERAANLLDGTATHSLADSVFGLYRLWFVAPVRLEGFDIDLEEFEEGIAWEDWPGWPSDDFSRAQPLVDRWDPLLARHSEGDVKKFAMLKAFLSVESGGRQYAVSPTGCVGLLQFCAGTAAAAPFRDVFGIGRVYRCECGEGECRVARGLQRALERGAVTGAELKGHRFPCELTDARFHPEKAVRAGSLYLERLRARHGDLLELLYIGFHSGPSIASRLRHAMGKDPFLSRAELELHLEDALRPAYGQASEARARELIDIALPNLKRAYERALYRGLPAR